MKRIYILLLTATVLASCEDIFVRKVDFEGETEPEMLVLSGIQRVGSRPSVEVSHSFFFDNKNKQPNDYVTDAEVSVRINGKSYGMPYVASGIYTSETIPVLQPGDTVEFIATHPNYAQARAKQVMPGQIQCELVSYELQPNNWLVFRLDFSPYKGNANDMTGIQANGVIKGTDKKGRKYTFRMNMLYSNDMVFAQALNPEAEGYYGASSGNWLYFPASCLETHREISLFVDTYNLNGWKKGDAEMEITSLTIEVIACTDSEYQFVQSTRSRYYSKYMYPPSGLPQQEENIMEEIMDAIQETLGDQEPAHVYTNVEGGLGHISGISCQTVISFDL